MNEKKSTWQKGLSWDEKFGKEKADEQKFIFHDDKNQQKLDLSGGEIHG